ncbi:hypothetical protein [Moraxella marmotae]|uniref:hypothetical protein n=1 Tax=Moraxella marmotae TaxID=3344520 RepID=UPI0035F3052E
MTVRKTFTYSAIAIAMAASLAACSSKSSTPASMVTPTVSNVKAEAKAKAEAEAKAKAEEARKQAEAKAKAEAEAKAKAEAEAKAKAEEARKQAEAKAKAEAEAKAKAEAEAKAKAEAEAKAKAEAEAKAKAEAEAKAKAEEARKQAEAKAKAEAEAKAKAEEARKQAEAKAKAEAEAKAKAEAEAKAKAEEARKQAEAEAKRQAELARTQPHDFKAESFTATGNDDFFEPILRSQYNFWTSETTYPLNNIVAANNSGTDISNSTINSQSITNGRIVNINAAYETYSVNLSDSAIAMIKGNGTYNGRKMSEFLYAYSGRATNANELDTLKGTAVYRGQGFSNGREYWATLSANFDTKKISGELGRYNESIALQEAAIAKTFDNKIGFSGKAVYTDKNVGTFNGTYDGAFMGRGAKEVVGKILISDLSIGGVFNATKQ